MTEKLIDSPIISVDMHPSLQAEADSLGYRNINGPSLISVFKSESLWEGSGLSIESSIKGEIIIPVKQLRDPDLFEDKDGRIFVMYAGSGEQNIEIRQLFIPQ